VIVGITLTEFKHSQLKECILLMQELFPVLTSLYLMADEEAMLVIPDTFLGGSAPLLQRICLCGIWFPGLPKLLASTCDLVYLKLEGFPMTGEGHISPDAMTTCLLVLTKLQSLTISSYFPQWTSYPHPTDQRPPSTAHTVLPALVYLWFEGPHGYLEDIVARVDAPLLNEGRFEFTDEPTFDTPWVPQFIRRTKVFKSLDGVQVHFSGKHLVAVFRSSIGPAVFSLSFWRPGILEQVAIMERVCAQWLPLGPHVELLRLNDNHSYFGFEQGELQESTPLWLGLLRRFTTVQTLRLCGMTIVSYVAHTLGELEGESATAVLPALHTIELSARPGFLPDPSKTLRLLGPFLAAREEWEHPVVVNVGSES